MADRRTLLTSLNLRRTAEVVSVVAGLVALAGVIGAGAIKANSKANADIRASMAQDRIAGALERLVGGLEAIPSRPKTAMWVNREHIESPPAPGNACAQTCDDALFLERGAREAHLPTLGGTTR